jgi:hypothetical protein
VKDLSRRQFGLVSGGAIAYCSISDAFCASNVASSSCDVSFDAPGGTSIDYHTVTPVAFEQNFENSLVWMLLDLATYLGVNFAYGYYKESGVPNAAFIPWNFFTPADARLFRLMEPGSPAEGAILLGTDLLQETHKWAKNFGAAVTSLCAHEAGHALQTKYKVKSQFIKNNDPNNQIRYELCADFISGYYGAHRQIRDPKYPAIIQAITQFRKGETGVRPVTHGNPAQREEAVRRGFDLGKKKPGDGKAATAEGVRFSLALKL